MNCFQLKAADSIQLASALTVKSEISYFIATDGKLLSSASKMKLSIINPYEKD
jgi:predicted nucleic acid-binding protein